ncbi:MAG: transposase [Alphaproteobacteria bacterium]
MGCRHKRGTSEQALGRSRGGFTCKVHCLSDARGLPLAFRLTPGEAADCTVFGPMMALADARPAYFLADKGYDSDAIRNALRADGIRPTIPPRSNRKAVIQWNKRIYRERDRHPLRQTRPFLPRRPSSRRHSQMPTHRDFVNMA